MKTFSIIDSNKPMQFFTDCTGCILVPKKMDQVVIITSTGEHVDIGIQLPHALSVKLYEKILEAAKAGGSISIPDFHEMNDDEIRECVDKIRIEA